MVIEWLKVNVVPEQREQYVQQDHTIWTAALSQYPGFLGKEVWISPDRLNEVVLVIRWETYEAWKAIPTEALEQIEAKFHAALGNTYSIVGSDYYQVQRFPT